MKNIIKPLVFTLAIFGISLSSVPAFAACSESNPSACATNICSCQCVSDEVKQASGCPGMTGQDISGAITVILNGIIAILGLVAVIFIIYGGVQYMTSAGDAAKLKKAKDTILYAAIGLIISVLAAAIVNFVINIVNQSTTQSNSNQNSSQPYYTNGDDW